nr:hypothetical protein [Fretibacterium fastidiosum]
MPGLEPDIDIRQFRVRRIKFRRVVKIREPGWLPYLPCNRLQLLKPGLFFFRDIPVNKFPFELTKLQQIRVGDEPLAPEGPVQNLVPPLPIRPTLPARSQANRPGVLPGLLHLAGDVQVVEAGRAFFSSIQGFCPAPADDLVVRLRVLIVLYLYPGLLRLGPQCLLPRLVLVDEGVELLVHSLQDGVGLLDDAGLLFTKAFLHLLVIVERQVLLDLRQVEEQLLQLRDPTPAGRLLHRLAGVAPRLIERIVLRPPPQKRLVVLRDRHKTLHERPQLRVPFGRRSRLRLVHAVVELRKAVDPEQPHIPQAIFCVVLHSVEVTGIPLLKPAVYLAFFLRVTGFFITQPVEDCLDFFVFVPVQGCFIQKCAILYGFFLTRPLRPRRGVVFVIAHAVWPLQPHAVQRLAGQEIPYSIVGEPLYGETSIDGGDDSFQVLARLVCQVVTPHPAQQSAGVFACLLLTGGALAWCPVIGDLVVDLCFLLILAPCPVRQNHVFGLLASDKIQLCLVWHLLDFSGAGQNPYSPCPVGQGFYHFHTFASGAMSPSPFNMCPIGEPLT